MPDTGPSSDADHQPETSEEEDVEALARKALRQAIASSQVKDEQTAKAISFYRRSAVVGMCAIFAVIGLHFYDQHESSNQTNQTDRLVICDSQGLNVLGQDLQTALSATGHITRSQIHIPAACTISP